MKSEISLKIDKEELAKIWRQFDRFALYSDLKKLHGIVVPEIAKFEVKILENEKKIKSYELILSNFD